jgi:putative sterol carrier protein
MTDNELLQRVEATTEKSDEELEAELPSLLDEMEGQTEELARDHPAVFGRMVNRMEEMDVARVVSANPDTADQFQTLLWTGMNVLVERTPEVKEQINEDITVNFTADDCPMEGHLEIAEARKTVVGGAGHLDDPTLEIRGPADTLVGLITGGVDPIRGFMQQRYEMDGPVQKGTQLAPIMNTLSSNIPS